MTTTLPALGRLERFTFKGNGKESRYGWLRLTPAYSLHLVSQLLDEQVTSAPIVLDPFCGTGTTALRCAERNIICDTTDINPFLVWLARTKTRNYSPQHLNDFAAASADIAEVILDSSQLPPWLPSLHHVEKWWDRDQLMALGRAVSQINSIDATRLAATVDLLKVAFCRTMIAHAKVSFGHQSMSFKRNDAESLFSFLSSAEQAIADTWRYSCGVMLRTAISPISRPPGVFLCDARRLTSQLKANHYTCVITSPPYPNRMSYIRELRPYMYWLGFLHDGREAGELDWKAIGGTWGCATSHLTTWKPDPDVRVHYKGFANILKNIEKHSPILSSYVHKYFCDMSRHCQELFRVVRANGTIHYIIGNSKFYNTLLPVESIFAALFKEAGFENVQVRPIRKRTSKRELYEFVVSAKKPSAS